MLLHLVNRIQCNGLILSDLNCAPECPFHNLKDNLSPVKNLPFARLHELELASYVGQASHIHTIEVHLHDDHHLTLYIATHHNLLQAAVLLISRFQNQDFQSGEVRKLKIPGANQIVAIVFTFTFVTIDCYNKFTAFVMIDMMIHRAQAYSLLCLPPLTALPQTCQKPSASCYGYWHMWLHLVSTQQQICHTSRAKKK